MDRTAVLNGFAPRSVDVTIGVDIEFQVQGLVFFLPTLTAIGNGVVVRTEEETNQIGFRFFLKGIDLTWQTKGFRPNQCLALGQRHLGHGRPSTQVLDQALIEASKVPAIEGHPDIGLIYLIN